MRANWTANLAALALLAGGLACASTAARTDETAAAAPVDTSTATARDTAGTENPPGYRGMERDTTMVPPGATSQPVDTFLQRQGTGAPQDTMGYSGLERDTTSHGEPQSREDSTGATDSTSGVNGADSTPADSGPSAGIDTTTAR